MREPAKSTLGNFELVEIIQYTKQPTVPQNSLIVADGDHSLQTVVWPQQSGIHTYRIFWMCTVHSV